MLLKRASVALVVLLTVPLATVRAEAGSAPERSPTTAPAPSDPVETPPGPTSRQDAPSPSTASRPAAVAPAQEFGIGNDCPATPSLCFRNLTIRVDAQPNAPTSFRFSARENETGRLESHTASEGSPAVVQTSKGKTYRIQVVIPPSYSVGVDCVGEADENGVGGVALETLNPFVDGDAVCTFRMIKRGSLEVRQVTNSPSSNRPAFSYTSTGPGLFTDFPDLCDACDFELDNDTSGPDRSDRPSQRQIRGLSSSPSPGTYTVTTARRTGFQLTSITCTTGEAVDLVAGRATITLAQGEDVVCTFTQTALASVRITVDVRPDDPTLVVFDSTPRVAPSVIILDDDGPGGSGRSNTRLLSNLLPGVLTLSQLTDLSGAGIDLRSIVCNGTVLSSSVASRTVSIRVDAGENIVCTYRNDERGSITIVSDSLPDSATDYTYASTASPPTFTLDDDATGTFPRQLTIPDVASGSRHVFTQGVPPGSPPWRLLSIVCNTSEQTDVPTRTATVTVDPGEDVICTFANAQFQPDALIGATPSGPFAGDDLRSPTVLEAQTLVKTVSADGRTVSFFVKVQNDSGIADDLIVRTVESGQGRFVVSYRRGTEDISAQVRSPGGFVFPTVAPGGERVVVIEFRSQSNSVPGSAKNANLSVTSTAAPAASDVVRARAERT